MKSKLIKFGCSGIVAFHLLWLSILFIAGEGILFGHRYFDEIIRTFSVIEIILSIVSLILIFKEKSIGYVLLTISILSTYIIQLGHRMLWWPCDYCSF
jgi:hypothetical protein